MVDITFGAATHAGLKRKANEDSYLAATPLFFVADGMGGHDAGARASAAVVDEFALLATAGDVSVESLRAALHRARVKVQAIDSGQRAAGTTLSGVAVVDVAGMDYWLTINVGDSRTYRYAHGVLEQISVDHSVVQELIDAGILDGASAQIDRRRNEITRAIGAGNDGEPDYWMVPVESGDRILVCSDGLSGEVDAARIARVLGDEDDPQEAATRLVHEALLSGGRDNVTAVIVDAAGGPAGDELFDTAPAGGRVSDIDADTRPTATRRGDH